MFCRSKLSPPHGKPTVQPKIEIPRYLFTSKQGVKSHIPVQWKWHTFCCCQHKATNKNGLENKQQTGLSLSPLCLVVINQGIFSFLIYLPSIFVKLLLDFLYYSACSDVEACVEVYLVFPTALNFAV